jgi:cytochrome P450
MRHHETVRLTAPLETPKEGLQIGGRWIPVSVTVNVATAVEHYRKEIFGNDADVFRPEQWLGDDKEEVQRMKKTMIRFGIGKYSCLGRYTVKLEIFKLIPSVLREFEVRSSLAMKIEALISVQFSLVEPETEWTLAGGVFVAPIDLNVRIQARN